MSRSAIALGICSAAGLILLPTSAAAAGPAGPNAVTMVVKTIFDPAQDSVVLEATGAFSECTTVTQLAEANKFVRGTAVFSGLKQINCSGGTIVLAYSATFDKTLPGAHGSWHVVGGTGAYAGLNGGGRLTGDDYACDPTGSDACVLDTYTGTLS
jgi:hypothetical protein